MSSTDNSRDPVIVAATRTASGRGKPGGGLSDVHPVDMLAQVFTHLLASTSVDPAAVDDVLVGCVSQVGEQAGTPGRMAWLGAGFPHSVPATTIDRKCGSSQQAVHFAAQGIKSGDYDIVVAAGVESMSRVRMGSAKGDADPFGSLVASRYAPGLVSQGVAAELVAAKWKLGREELDIYSAESHRRAAAAQDSGLFDREIVPVHTERGVFLRDETIRPNTTADTLSVLQPAFASDDSRARFPQLEFAVTAGNSSQITDGASGLLMMSRAACDALGLTARARIHTTAVRGDDPVLMLTAILPATEMVLSRSGLSMRDIDHVEVNEAFASVPLSWMAEYPIDPAKVNPRGGAIALGHPLGASGTRIATTMLHALEDCDQQFGLQLMCEAGGMANAMIVERVS
ncbi:thiolase family protein [Nocardia fluminea]|uniref:thiolase family protein n=1 Tax=Nocardia fluminea TaxID=134984 RepID=UPI00343C120F